MTNARDDTEAATKSFLEHLQDLRQALFWSVLSVCFGIAVAIPLTPWIMRVLQYPLAEAGVDPHTFLRVIKVAGGLTIGMRLVFWAGLLISVPLISIAASWFIFPGLTVRERRVVKGAAGFAVCLFLAGVAMGYFMTLPLAFQMMFKINAALGITCDFFELSDYVAFVLKLLLAFGVAFELPVVVLALGWLGIISSSQLRAKRPVAIVAILTVAMLLTPPDPLTQLMMGVPMIVLYEMCIWMIWIKERRKPAAL